MAWRTDHPVKGNLGALIARMAGFAAPDTLRGRYMALATRHGAETC